MNRDHQAFVSRHVYKLAIRMMKESALRFANKKLISPNLFRFIVTPKGVELIIKARTHDDLCKGECSSFRQVNTETKLNTSDKN